MLWFYRLIFLPGLLVATPYYLLRMWKRGGYRAGFGQRFGAVPPLPPKRAGVKRIWLQAVSVGEMLAIAPLLERLAARGNVEIYLTTTTSTGHQIACEKYQRLTIGIGYFPIDAWVCSARAWRAVAPDLVLLTEGERWPEHIAQAARRGVPVLCVNARLSDRSFARMLRWRGCVRPLLAGVTKFLACSADDAARLKQISVDAARVATTGNIKLDVTIPELSEAEHVALRAELGLGESTRPVLLGSSTWPGEERVLVELWQRLEREGAGPGAGVDLLLVPRHAERRAEVAAELGAAGMDFHLRSKGRAPAGMRIVIADTTGELKKLTRLADVVFVGKSLPPHIGGQTPVEAAAMGKAIVLGPEMSNFRVIVRELLAAGGARQVGDAAELGEVLARLLANEQERAELASAARRWHQANRGAIERTLAEIEAYL